MSGRLQVDTNRHIHDTLDGETIILDSVEGRLTLLVGLAPAMWSRILAGAGVEPLIAEIADRFGADAGDDARRFIDQLIEAGLATREDGSVGESVDGSPWPAEYQAPGLEQYADIADIMTMDPIHEIDTSRGWPHGAAADG